MAAKRIFGVSMLSGLLIAAVCGTAFAAAPELITSDDAEVLTLEDTNEEAEEILSNSGSVSSKQDTMQVIAAVLSDAGPKQQELAATILTGSQKHSRNLLNSVLAELEAEESEEMERLWNEKEAVAEFLAENYDQIATITADGVRLREAPGTDADVIATVYEGMTFDVQEETDEAETEEADDAAASDEGWYFGSEEYLKQQEADTKRREERLEWTKISYFGRTGYVASDYTDVTYEEKGTVEFSDRISQEEYELFAALVFCEAGGEPYAGQLAVASVVLNRVDSSSYPSTITDVIYQSGQFSPARSGSLARALAQGKATASCYQAVSEALAGGRNVSCLHFHAGTRGSGTVIGHQIFY